MKEILELTKDTCTPDIEHGTTCSDMGTYNGDDIMNGLNLVHHSETLSSDDQIMRTLGIIRKSLNSQIRLSSTLKA